MSNETTPSQNMYPHAMDQVPGITFRQYAAVHILCAILNSPKVKSHTKDRLEGYIEGAVQFADLLENELQK